MLTYLLAALVGLSLGLLGSGGSILAVPILRYSAGLSAQEAVATSLATVGAVAFVGTFLAWREGRIAWREGLLFSLVATLGTFGGVELARRMTGTLQMWLFIIVMGYAVYRMVKSPEQQGSESKSQSALSSLLKALGVGVLTGLVGVGGGFLIVPALVALFHLPMKRATGTSLLVIAVNSAVGTFSYSQAIDLNWTFTLNFIGFALAGLLLGMGLSRRIREDKLKTIFAAVLGVVCLYTAVQEALLLL